MVQVYRGKPGWKSAQVLRVSWDRRTARWRKLPGVRVQTRNMRYQPEEDPTSGEIRRWVGQEKGIDVLLAVDLVRGAYNNDYDIAVVMSRDSDLLPAFEEVLRLGKRVERAVWWTPPQPKGKLVVAGRSLWTHYLDEDNFNALRDDTDYSL